MNETNNLNQVVHDVASEMERLGYSHESMCHYWEVWKRFLKFTSQTSIDRDDIDSFLKQTYGIKSNSKKTTRYQRGAIRAMNVLQYYNETGKIYIRGPLPPPIPTAICIQVRIAYQIQGFHCIILLMYLIVYPVFMYCIIHGNHIFGGRIILDGMCRCKMIAIAVHHYFQGMFNICRYIINASECKGPCC